MVIGTITGTINGAVVGAEDVKEEGMTCKSKIINDNLVCMETVEYSPEISTLHMNGETTYRKKVIIKREYKKSGTLEALGDCKLSFTFKYDKKSFVRCEPEVIKKSKKGAYYLKFLTEILPEEKVSTGSVKYNLYQKNILESYDYILDGHIDVFCSYMGDLGINSNV